MASSFNSFRNGIPFCTSCGEDFEKQKEFHPNERVIVQIHRCPKCAIRVQEILAENCKPAWVLK